MRTKSTKTQGKLLIGLGWSEGAHFIKIGLKKWNRLYQKELNLPADFYIWYLRKNFGSTGNPTFDSHGNSYFVWEINIVPVEGEFVLFLQHCHGPLKRKWFPVRPGSIAAGTWATFYPAAAAAYFPCDPCRGCLTPAGVGHSRPYLPPCPALCSSQPVSLIGRTPELHNYSLWLCGTAI